VRSDLRVVLGKLLCFLRPGFCHHDVMWVNTDGFSVELVSWALKVGTAHCCETSVSTDSSTLNQNSKTVWRVKCALSFYSTEWATKKYPVYRFARVLVIFSLALVCILRRVSEQLVKNRAVTVLRYTRCNIVILMTASAWLMLSSSSSIVCGSDSYTVLFMCPQRKFLGGVGIFSGDTWKVRYMNQIRTRYRNWKTSATKLQPSNPHTIQELKDNISHGNAAITITMLHPVYLNMIRRKQLCINAGGNHLQHLLWWYNLSAFGYCVNFCFYAMLRTRATFSWPILYIAITLSFPNALITKKCQDRFLLKDTWWELIM